MSAAVTPTHAAFRHLKARYAIAAIALSYYWQPGAEWLADAVAANWYVWSLVGQYYAHASLAAFAIGAALIARVRPRAVFGRRIEVLDWHSVLLIAALSFFGSMAVHFATHLPLSYLLPDFIQWWLNWAYWPVVFLDDDGSLPVIANVLSFVSLVVLAPVIEEVLFRGYLLHRWSRKWGLRAGVVVSSAVFGALHPDTLAATLSGLLFALLYLKTRTLWAPILAHAAHNFAVWTWEFSGTLTYGWEYYAPYTLETLRADWWYGVGGLVITLLLIDWRLRSARPLGPLALPR